MKLNFTTIQAIELADKKTTEIEVLREGVIHDRGLKITREMLTKFVVNFDANVVGVFDEKKKPELPVNVQHFRGSEAVGWIKNLTLKGESLVATIEWTELGQEKIKKRLFKFISAEFATEYPHHESGELTEHVFLGAGLTNTPALKKQKPIALSEKLHYLINKDNLMFKKLLEKYKGREFVSKEDKELLNELYVELSEEEQKENVDAKADVDNKPEEKEKEGDEGNEGDEGDGEGDDDGDDKDKEGGENLSEANARLTTLEVENKKLREKVERRELSDQADTSFVLSSERNIGIRPVDKDAIVLFMLSLDDKQRKQFSEIMSKVVHVELSTLGSTDMPKSESDDDEEKVTTLAEKLLKDGKAKDIIEAQDMAMEQLKK